jgi:hypothetical protein
MRSAQRWPAGGKGPPDWFWLVAIVIMTVAALCLMLVGAAIEEAFDII